MRLDIDLGRSGERKGTCLCKINICRSDYMREREREREKGGKDGGIGRVI